MKKLKLYLDTSLINHLKANDVPEKMFSSLKLWNEIKVDKYEVYISSWLHLKLRIVQNQKEQFYLVI